MPKFKITDNQTGKTVTVSGDMAPTEQEAENIFRQAGLRGEQPEPSSIPAIAGSIIGGTTGLALGPLGALAGAGVGAAAGESIAGAVRGLQGESLPPEEELQRLGTETKKGVAGELFGLGLGQVAGRVVAPLAGRASQAIGRKLTQTGTDVLASRFGQGIEKGFDVFDELVKRKLTTVPRQQALNQIKTSLSTTEKTMLNAIENAGNPQVITKRELRSAFNLLKKEAVEQNDKQSISNLSDNILESFKNTINSKDSLDLKRKLFEKGFGKNSTLNQARTSIANLVNKTLKGKVPAVGEGLREQEILLTLRPVLTRLRNKEGVQGLSFNVFNPLKSAVQSLGTGRVSQAGQFLEKIPQTQLPQLGNIIPRLAGQGAVGAVSQ